MISRFLKCITQKIATRRNIQASILCAGFCLFTGFGYVMNSMIHPPNNNDDNEAPKKHITLTKVDSFATAKTSQEPAVAQTQQEQENTPRPTSRSGVYVSLPVISAIPQGIPASSPVALPDIPAIPANPYATATVNTTAAMSNSATENTVPEKPAQEDTHQSRIAFIGGDGLKFGKQTATKNK